MYKYLFENLLAIFLDISRSGVAGSYGNPVFRFSKNLHCFPQWLHFMHFTFPPTVHKNSNFSVSLIILIIIISIFESALTKG